MSRFLGSSKVGNRTRGMFRAVTATALFGALVLTGGCSEDDNPAGDGKTDVALNGTWVPEGGSQEIKFDNGNYELTLISEAFSDPYYRSTYTTSDGIINYGARTNDQFNGAYFIATFAFLGNPDPYGFESRWYSRDEYNSKLKAYMVPSLMTEEDFNRTYVNPPPTVTSYSVSGNTLTITNTGEVYESMGGSYTQMYTRK